MSRVLWLAPVLVLAFSHVALAGDEAAIKLGKDVFQGVAGPPCGLCHTLKDAESQSDIGPALDTLKPTPERVEKAVRSGVGVMPPFAHLSEEQIKAVSIYVASVAGK